MTPPPALRAIISACAATLALSVATPAHADSAHKPVQTARLVPPSPDARPAGKPVRVAQLVEPPRAPSPDPDKPTSAPQKPLSRANGPDWAFGSPWGDVALSAVSVASLATIFIPQQETGWMPSSHTRWNPTLGTISNFTGSAAGSGIAMLGGYGLEVWYYKLNGADSPWTLALRSSLIEAEALTLTTGITMGLKAVTGRCRPRAYGNGGCAGNEWDAFPSGHTSAISAIAGVRLVNALKSTGNTMPRWLSFGLAEAASVGTGALRIGSGAHSWEDVAAGWAIGHVTGAALALAHKWLPKPAVTVPVYDLPGAAHPTEIPLPPAAAAATIGASWAFHF